VLLNFLSMLRVFQLDKPERGFHTYPIIYRTSLRECRRTLPIHTGMVTSTVGNASLYYTKPTNRTPIQAYSARPPAKMLKNDEKGGGVHKQLSPRNRDTTAFRMLSVAAVAVAAEVAATVAAVVAALVVVAQIRVA
jgi:hypothetical protein